MLFDIKNLIYLLIPLIAGSTLFRMMLTREAARSLGMQPAVIMILLPTVAFLSPTIWIVYAVALLIVPLTAKRIEDVAPLYMTGLLAIPGLAIDLRAGSVYLMPISAYLALGLGSLLALATTSGRAAKPGFLFDLTAAIIPAMFILGSAREGVLSQTLRFTLDYALMLFLPYFIVSRSVGGADQVRRLMLHFSFAATVLSAVSIFEAVKRWPLYRGLYLHYPDVLVADAALGFKMRGGLLRSSGPFPESTAFALFLAMGLIASWGLNRSFGSRAKYWMILIVGGAGLVPTMSRGGWLGAVVGIAMYEIAQRRFRSVGLLAGAGAAFLVLATPLAPHVPILGAMIGTQGDAGSTGDYRERLFTRGVEEIKKKPVFGDTLASIQVKMADMRQGEGIIDFVNGYIYVALLTGLVGLLAFFWALIFPVLAIERARPRWRHIPAAGIAAAFTSASMVMLVVQIGFTSYNGLTQLFTVVLIACGAGVVKSKLPRAARRPDIVAARAGAERVPA